MPRRTCHLQSNERVINHRHTLEDGVLEIDAVIRDFVRDTINNDRVRTRFIHACAAELDELGDDTFIATVDFFNESGRKGPFPPYQQADLQSHSNAPLSIVTTNL